CFLSKMCPIFLPRGQADFFATPCPAFTSRPVGFLPDVLTRVLLRSHSEFFPASIDSRGLNIHGELRRHIFPLGAPQDASITFFFGAPRFFCAPSFFDAPRFS